MTTNNKEVEAITTDKVISYKWDFSLRGTQGFPALVKEYISTQLKKGEDYGIVASFANAVNLKISGAAKFIRDWRLTSDHELVECNTISTPGPACGVITVTYKVKIFFNGEFIGSKDSDCTNTEENFYYTPWVNVSIPSDKAYISKMEKSGLGIMSRPKGYDVWKEREPLAPHLLLRHKQRVGMMAQKRASVAVVRHVFGLNLTQDLEQAKNLGLQPSEAQYKVNELTRELKLKKGHEKSLRKLLSLAVGEAFRLAGEIDGYGMEEFKKIATPFAYEKGKVLADDPILKKFEAMQTAIMGKSEPNEEELERQAAKLQRDAKRLIDIAAQMRKIKNAKEQEATDNKAA